MYWRGSIFSGLCSRGCVSCLACVSVEVRQVTEATGGQTEVSVFSMLQDAGCSCLYEQALCASCRLQAARYREMSRRRLVFLYLLSRVDLYFSCFLAPFSLSCGYVDAIYLHLLCYSSVLESVRKMLPVGVPPWSAQEWFSLFTNNRTSFGTIPERGQGSSNTSIAGL